MITSMEISLYPLGATDVSTPVNSFIEMLQKYELKITVGSMSTLVVGESDILFRALHKAYETAASDESVALVVKISNACPVK